VSRRATALRLAIIPLLAGVVLVWRVVAWHPQSVPDTAVTDGFVRVSGVAHIHTIHSDGGGTVADVESAAAAAGLDFVIITDHNSLAGKPREGYGNTGVLTIIGTEISNHEGHLLAVGLPSPPTYRFSGDGLDTLRDLDDLGSLSFAAHPENPREDLRWTGWSLPGNWGIEILNGDSQWRAAGWTSVVGAALRYPLNSDYSLLRLMRRSAALSRWDDLLARRHAPAIAGADAHGTLPPAAGLPLPSYEAVFRIAQNYVLLERPLRGAAPADTAAILAALARGRAYIGVGALAPADRFFFLAERDGGRWTMGDTVASGGPVRLHAGGALPTGARITLYRDGVTVTTADGELDTRVTEPGIYRVEVQVPGWDIPWIVSNPIYVLTEPERKGRARAAELPAPVVADAADTLEPFNSDSTFVAVADDSTRQNVQFIDPDTGPDGSSAARIAFRLGEPNTEHPSPFASLGSYQPRDLGGRNGLVFSLKSDDTYRLWVQVRDRNLETPGGTESWFASVKTGNTWRTVTLPFDRLRSVDPHTDGTLDLADIVAIVFLVDVGAVPPGTEGVIWLDDLGVY